MKKQKARLVGAKKYREVLCSDCKGKGCDKCDNTGKVKYVVESPLV